MKINSILWILAFILSISLVSAGNVSWSVPVYVVYNGEVTLYANDGYTNVSIANFSAIVTDLTDNYARQFNASGYNISVDIVQGNNYSLTYIQPNYLNTTISQISFNTIYNNYTALMNQTQVTLVFRHAFSHEIINNRNITLTDNTNNLTFTTSDGVIYTNMPAGGVSITVNVSANYLPLSEILTLTPQQTGPVNIDLFPILNVSIYDEKKSLINLTYFNFSNPKTLQYTIYCSNSNQTISQLIPNSTPMGPYSIGTPCAYQNIKFDLQYLQQDNTILEYYRNMILPSTITQFDFAVFLVDLADNTPVVQTILQPYDLFGIYTQEANTKLFVYELMPSGVQLISSDYVDAEGKVTEYLLQGGKYQLTIMADNAPTKTLGNYYADTSGSKTLQLNNIAITTNGALTPATIIATSSVQPIDNSSGVILTQFFDPTNTTSTVTISVYNVSCSGTPLQSMTYNYLQLNGSQRQIDQTYNVAGSRYMNGTSNQKYCTQIDRVNTDYTTDSSTNTLIYDSFLKMPAQFKNYWTFPWIIMLFIIVIAMGANFRTAPIVSLIIAVLAFILYSWNWFATAHMPGVLPSVSLAVAVLLAILFNIKRTM